MRRLLATALVLLAPVAVALAEQRLHERVDDPGRGEGPLLDQPAEGENPAALRVGRREVPEPRHTEALGDGELPMTGAGATTPAGIGRLQRWRPDLATAAFPEFLQYTATFQPSISPHKRMTALDAVGPGYELTVADRELRELSLIHI